MTSLTSSLILVSIVSPKSLNRRYTSHVVQFEEARVPFIYLSAGMSESVFRASLELAKEAHVPYSGVLCGRATWQGGLAAYIEGGKDALRTWLGKRGVQNIEALNEVLQHGAQPWWNIYGGQDQIEIVNGSTLPSSDHQDNDR
jgi:hypothetical protein